MLQNKGSLRTNIAWRSLIRNVLSSISCLLLKPMMCVESATTAADLTDISHVVFTYQRWIIPILFLIIVACVAAEDWWFSGHTMLRNIPSILLNSCLLWVFIILDFSLGAERGISFVLPWTCPRMMNWSLFLRLLIPCLQIMMISIEFLASKRLMIPTWDSTCILEKVCWGICVVFRHHY